MPVLVQIKVNEQLYLRDPEQTDLGRKIVSDGILLIEELGFDSFTFKKLAERIESTEASIYRYFSSKTHLLQYLVSWYWSWLGFVLEFRTTNIEDPRKKLDLALEILSESDKYDPAISHIDEAVLHKIIVSESARVYLTKQDDSIKAKYLFQSYDELIELFSSYIKGVSPRYKFANSLTNTLVSTVHRQIFYAENFPGTARFDGKKNDRKAITRYISHLIYSCLD